MNYKQYTNVEQETDSQRDTEIEFRDSQKYDCQEMRTIDKTLMSNHHSESHDQPINEEAMVMSLMKEERASQITKENMV